MRSILAPYMYSLSLILPCPAGCCVQDPYLIEPWTKMAGNARSTESIPNKQMFKQQEDGS